MDVHVLQGERQLATDNISLGRFRLEGIPVAPRGLPQIEVTFDIDANGILNVTAKDKASGKEQRVTITASTNMDKSEIERLVQEAKQHEAEDLKRKELIEARNNADQIIYAAEKELQENSEFVNYQVKNDIETKLNSLKEEIKSDNLSMIREKSKEVENALQNYISSKNNAQSSTNEDRSGQENGEEVVEGEFQDI